MRRCLLPSLILAVGLGCQPAANNGMKDMANSGIAHQQEQAKTIDVVFIVRAVVAEQFKLRPEKIKMKKLLSDPPIHADDLDLVELIMTLEKRFGITIPDKIIEKHGGGKLGERTCKLSPFLLVDIVEESRALASKNGK